MDSYDWAFTKTAKLEGGFVDHPHDPGGATHLGVSLRFLRQQGLDIDGDGDIDQDDIKAISPRIAKHIYRRYFWEPARCDSIHSELLAVKIFDMAVNMGQRQAYRIVQRAVNTLGLTSQLTVDGVVGPATLSALNELKNQDYLALERIRTEQAAFYENLIESRPELATFRLGWRRRAAA